VRRRAIACLAVALPALCGVAAPDASARADLVMSAVSEPPDFEVAGGRFRHSYTVANNGNAAAAGSRVTAFLSSDPVRGSDVALRTTARTTSLIQTIPTRKQRSRRVTLNIPETVPAGFYFLIDCADGNRKVRESREGNNCRVSGQRIGINASERGEPGPAGPQGPPGAAGKDVDRRRIPRTVLDLGARMIDGPETDPGDDEGSTSTKELAKVGPISVRALCRQTTNGDGDPAGSPFTDATDFDEDGDEVKILLYADSGTFSFQGLNGARADVQAGEGVAGNEGPDGGEGHHMFLAAKRDPDPDTTSGNQHNGIFERQWAFAFRSVTGWVSHSNGMELMITAYVGIDVLDVGDRCVAGGVVTVVNPGA
jgi:CARDB protein